MIDLNSLPKDVLISALEQSVRLQSHYAKLLNECDGGDRIVFDTGKNWINRLIEIGNLRIEDK